MAVRAWPLFDKVTAINKQLGLLKDRREHVVDNPMIPSRCKMEKFVAIRKQMGALEERIRQILDSSFGNPWMVAKSAFESAQGSRLTTVPCSA